MPTMATKDANSLTIQRRCVATPEFAPTASDLRPDVPPEPFHVPSERAPIHRISSGRAAAIGSVDTSVAD